MNRMVVADVESAMFAMISRTYEDTVGMYRQLYRQLIWQAASICVIIVIIEHIDLSLPGGECLGIRPQMPVPVRPPHRGGLDAKVPTLRETPVVQNSKHEGDHL